MGQSDPIGALTVVAVGWFIDGGAGKSNGIAGRVAGTIGYLKRSIGENEGEIEGAGMGVWLEMRGAGDVERWGLGQLGRFRSNMCGSLERSAGRMHITYQE